MDDQSAKLVDTAESFIRAIESREALLERIASLPEDATVIMITHFDHPSEMEFGISMDRYHPGSHMSPVLLQGILSSALSMAQYNMHHPRAEES